MVTFCVITSTNLIYAVYLQDYAVVKATLEYFFRVLSELDRGHKRCGLENICLLVLSFIRLALKLFIFLLEGVHFFVAYRLDGFEASVLVLNLD